jgi:hypothetical protein
MQRCLMLKLVVHIVTAALQRIEVRFILIRMMSAAVNQSKALSLHSVKSRAMKTWSAGITPRILNFDTR